MASLSASVSRAARSAPGFSCVGSFAPGVEIVLCLVESSTLFVPFLFTAMGKIVSESESAIYFVAQRDRTSINLLRV